MSKLKEAVIYWIHLPEHTDIATEGYVGVSQNFEKRINDHYTAIQKNNHKNAYLMNAVAKYGWENVIKEIWLNGEESYCYQQESIIRPHRAVGWNIAPGGHRGPGWPLGKKRDPEWLEHQRKKRAPILEQKRLMHQEEKNKKLEERRKKKEEKKILLEAKKNILAKKRAQQKKLKDERKEKRDLLEKKRLETGFYLIDTKNRPLCKVCNKNPRAPAYYRAGKRYFRSRCSTCIAKNRSLKIPEPRWKSKGYKKKAACDMCGFKGQYSSQIVVYHTDGDLNNCDLLNLRSICLCCVEVVKRKHFTWRLGEIQLDY